MRVSKNHLKSKGFEKILKSERVRQKCLEERGILKIFSKVIKSIRAYLKNSNLWVILIQTLYFN